MRCPDCNKFTGMDNGDPEVQQDPELTFNMRTKKPDGTEIPASFDVTASVRGVRVCADCGTELKELNMDLEDTVELPKFEGWDKLTPEQQGELLGRLEAGTVKPEIETGDTSVDESGGSRFKKNLITTVLSYTITIVDIDQGIKLTHNGDMSYEAAASEFEECC